MSAAVQLWSVRDQLKSEPEKTLRKLYDLGFREVEGFDLVRLAELVPIYSRIAQEIRSQYLLAYSPKPPVADPWPEVEVKPWGLKARTVRSFVP